MEKLKAAPDWRGFHESRWHSAMRREEKIFVFRVDREINVRILKKGRQKGAFCAEEKSEESTLKLTNTKE